METKALSWEQNEWIQVDVVDLDVNTGSAQPQTRNNSPSPTVVQRSRLHIWLVRLSTSILLWTCLIQLMALAQIWHPHILTPRASCYSSVAENKNAVNDSHSYTNKLLAIPSLLTSMPSSSNGDGNDQLYSMEPATIPIVSPAIISPVHLALHSERKYKSNGYLLLSCNGGLNQMRAAICDMVAVARYLNLTLVVPELDKASFWADPSVFGDIFDVNHFINSLRNEIKIVKKIPSKFRENGVADDIMSIPPVSWSNESYYMNQILPLIKKQKILRFSKTDTRLANNGLPIDIQKLRCKVNFEALKFTNHIEELGKRLVKYLQAKGPFLVLHLRYEMDMLAFSGCTHGCTEEEADNLTKLRYAYPWWREKVINSEQKRLDGLCPLTPEEAVLFLQALGFNRDTQIYIAAGEIYGSVRRMEPLYTAYPNTVRKETILSTEDLKSFQNHSSQMAALDYLVSIASDFFLPTYDGNMAKVVEGHRRFLGFKKTILPNRKKLVELIDNYANGLLKWDEFSRAVMKDHSIDMGAPKRRYMIPDRPKEEDYFYANPVECIAT